MFGNSESSSNDSDEESSKKEEKKSQNNSRNSEQPDKQDKPLDQMKIAKTFSEPVKPSNFIINSIDFDLTSDSILTKDYKFMKQLYELYKYDPESARMFYYQQKFDADIKT